MAQTGTGTGEAKHTPACGTFYTVAADHLRAQADQMEQDAEGSLKAWALLGQTDRHSEAMSKVRGLRAAAAERSLHIRREILRNTGFEVRTPRQAGSCCKGAAA